MSIMDSSKFGEIGRYGTIYFMKRNEPDTVVTAFGINTEQLTFGRDTTCDVRLYYPNVSLLHCKIIFEERKAFLVVLGANGLFVDRCKVYPSSSNASPSAGPTTIPLANNSEIEIHNKRFRFTYPPKELRAALLATPSRTPSGTTRRALRMSMIQSAQVFSPRPSKDPRENLRILQSPLKPFRSPVKPSMHSQHADEHEDEEIVLVDGNHPRVVEDDRDLIILEDVELPSLPSPDLTPTQATYRAAPGSAPPRTPTRVFSGRVPAPPMLPVSQPLLQTPRRGPTGPRATLHRAVLIRSAQRAVMKAEIEREEEAEEEEVLEVVADAVGESESDSSQSQSEDDGEGNDGEGSEDGEESEKDDEERQKGKSAWRKSLERIWPFGSSTQGQGADENNEDGEEEKDEEPAPLPVAQTPGRPMRTLGSFMTPQRQPSSTTASRGQGRFSLGGGEARRVQVEQPWRVRDIVLTPAMLGRGIGTRTSIKDEDDGRFGQRVNKTEQKDVRGWNISGVGRGRGLGRDVSEEERKAIQERRRSALRTPDTFFGGQAPGTRGSPTKGSLVSPTKPASVAGNDKTQLRVKDNEEQEQLDTRSLLERMKETVEGMKARRSMAPRASLDPGSVRSRVSLDVGGAADETGDKRESLGVGFGVSPRKRVESGDSEKEVFSLLAPAAREEVFGGNNDEGGAGEAGMDVDEESGTENEAISGSEREDEGDRKEIIIEPKTPTFKVMRHLVGNSKPARTPPFRSVKDMTQVGTPVFEGVGEMMRTPVGWRGAEMEADTEADIEEQFVEEEIVPAKKSTRGKTTDIAESTTRRKNQRATASKDTPSLADDEATPGAPLAAGKMQGKQADSDVEEDSGGIPKRKARLLRGKGSKVDEECDKERPPPKTRNTKIEESEEMSEQATGKASKTKISKSKMKNNRPTEEDESEDPTPIIPSRPAARRGRKPVAESTSTNEDMPSLAEDDGEVEPPAKAPGRRGRKPATELATSASEGPQHVPPAKPVRKTRGIKQSPAQLDSEVPVNPARKGRSKGKSQDTDDEGTGKSERRGTRVKPIDVEPDDDPLDSLGGTEGGADVVPVAKNRRNARAKPIEAIKEEIVDPGLETAEAETAAAAGMARGGRGKKTQTPASTGAPPKSRTRAVTSAKKTSSVPVADVPSENGVDKENTPGSVDDEEVAEKSVKIRVSRSRKGAAAKVKEENLTEPELPPRTRAARTRSKT